MAAKLLCGSALAVLASAGCIDDLQGVVKDTAATAIAIKGLVKDCRGDDRSQCQADVGALLDSLDQLQKDIAPCTTSCGTHGPDCVDSINKLGDDIGAIKQPAKDMADKCAGKDKNTMECIFDGIKVGTDSVKVISDVHTTIAKCKKGDNAIAEPNGIKCELCEEFVKAVKGKAVDECDTLCKKTPFDSACEQLCALIQTEPADKICAMVKLCDGSDATAAAGIPPAVVEEIKKLVCIAVKDEVPEAKFASTTCQYLRKTVLPFLSEQECEDVASQIYKDTLSTCPKSMMLAPRIEEAKPAINCAVCTLNDGTVMHNCNVGPWGENCVCGGQAHHWTKNCHGAIEAPRESGLPDWAKKEIEKLVCTAVKDEVPEDKFASTTCEDMKKIVKFLPEQTCEDAVKKIFEDTLASCPKSIVV